MEDYITYLINFGTNLPAIQDFFLLACGLAGIILVFASIVHQARAGRRGDSPLPATIAGLFVGSFMLSLTTIVDVIAVTFLGTNADTRVVTSYAPVSGDNVKVALQVIVLFVNLIGWFAAAKGLWRWRVGNKYDQPGWFGSGAVFLLAGAGCTNLYVIADMIAVSVGAQPVGTEYFKFN